jgi:adenosylhomocysteine nucleosidase
VPEAIVYADVDITPLGFAFGQMMGSESRFRASPELLARFRSLLPDPAVPVACHHGLLGSSDSFIYRPDQLDSIRRHFGAEVQCVDMEGGAIAHVCTRFGVPFLILRALSDFPGNGDNAFEFQKHLRRAAKNSAALCLRLVQLLEASEAL